MLQRSINELQDVNNCRNRTFNFSAFPIFNVTTEYRGVPMSDRTLIIIVIALSILVLGVVVKIGKGLAEVSDKAEAFQQGPVGKILEKLF